tara:strand:- start:116 stop:403 length:288 start_codon:yes stop_codon:yes gene_type:complete
MPVIRGNIIVVVAPPPVGTVKRQWLKCDNDMFETPHFKLGSGINVGDILTVRRRLGSGWIRAKTWNSRQLITMRVGAHVMVINNDNHNGFLDLPS